VVGVFPSEKSLANLATAVMLGASARPRSGWCSGLGIQALPGHGPAVGWGGGSHKKRDLTSGS